MLPTIFPPVAAASKVPKSFQYMRFTEQGAFCDGTDNIQGRKEGTRGLLELLAKELDAALKRKDVDKVFEALGDLLNEPD